MSVVMRAGHGRATDARDGGLLLQKLLHGDHFLRRWQSCSDRTNGSRQAAEFPCMPRGHRAKGEGGRGAGRGGRRRRRSQEEATRRRRPYTSKRHNDTDARVAAQRLSLAVPGAKKVKSAAAKRGVR